MTSLTGVSFTLFPYSQYINLFYMIQPTGILIQYFYCQQKYYLLLMEDPTDPLSSCLPNSPTHAHPPEHHSIYDSYYLESPSFHQQEQIPMVISLKFQRKNNDGAIEEEEFTGFQLDRYTEDGICKLEKLLAGLCLAMNIALQSHQILILDVQGEIFVNFGTYPLLHASFLSLDHFCPKGVLTLRAIRTHWSQVHMEMSRDITQHLTDGPPRLLQRGEPAGQRQRTSIKNFQKIGYIVKKILNLKSKKGAQQLDFELKNDRKLTKKSIEDYLYQIKQGFKYNFDFNANSNRNMKFLRDFVRERDDEVKRRTEESQRKGYKGGLEMGNKPTRCSDESSHSPFNQDA